MRLATLIAPGVIAAGFAIGWLFAPPIPAPPPGHSAAAPKPIHGGEELGASVRVLSELQGGGGQQLAEAPPAIDLPPAPPPIDIGAEFRRELTAIVGGRALWVIDETALLRRRELHVGDEYKDGWRVASIDDTTVSFRKRRERLTFNVVEPVSPDRIAPPPTPDEPYIPPSASLNGVNQRATVGHGIDTRRSAFDD